MGWLSNLFTENVSGVITAVGNAVDQIATNDEERLKLKNELVTIELRAKLDAQKQADDAEIRLEEEVTKRWSADTSSDDPLAKKVRPGALIFLLFTITFFVFVDSTNYFDFDIRQAYVDLYESLLLLVFAAYFGGRTLEKVMGRKK